MSSEGTLHRRVEIEAVTTKGQLRRLGVTVAPINCHQNVGHMALCVY